MFYKNDKKLLVFRLIVAICCVFGAVFGFVYGLVTVIQLPSAWVSGLVMMLSPLWAGLVWLAAEVVFSFLFDVKLIRNKLYGISNEDIDKYVKEPVQVYPTEQTEPTAAQQNAVKQQTQNPEAE